MKSIFEKHWDALVITAESTTALSLPAVRLALHLAIKEASADQSTQPAAWQREAENAYKQIGRLNEWLEKNHPALYHSPSHDTAGAMIHLYDEVSRELIQMKRVDAEGHTAMLQLRAELASALADVKALGEELRKAEAMTAKQPDYDKQQNALLTQWLIDNEPAASLTCDDDKGVAGVIIDTLNRQRVTIEDLVSDLTSARNETDALRGERARLKAEIDVLIRERDQAEYEAQALQRAAAVDPTPAPDWGPSHPAWQGLTAVEQETVSRLATGEIKWRMLSKALRRDLATRALQHLSAERAISSGAFDKTRPSWMPTANTLGATVAQSWRDLQTAASAA